MVKQTVSVPDIGGAENVDVIEVCVALGDTVAVEDSLLVLESDKASMDVPSPIAGEVVSLLVKEGDQVSEGTAIVELEAEGETSSQVDEASVEEPQATSAEPVSQAELPSSPATVSVAEMPVLVPDIGGAEGVDVIEICVAVDDVVAEGDSLVVLESDKAAMEVPSPAGGKVVSISLSEGAKVSEGDAILVLAVEAAESAPASEPAPAAAAPAVQSAPAVPASPTPPSVPQTSNELHPQDINSPGSEVYAGPAVRKLARQLGVNLAQVQPSGPRGRLSKDDVKAHVKAILQSNPNAATGGSGIPAVPEVDFSKFGEIDIVKMEKIHKITAANMSRNWLNVPHVTQFDEADITDLEEFRKSIKAEAEKSGIKITPLPFLLKACADALKYEPSFNTSIHADGEHIVRKKYVHIGVAVATEKGLMVPVVRDVDQKGLYELAEESSALAKKARDGKLLPKEMQGGCFTISSLGPIGGTGFTPIVNAPEVAILGVSKANIKPVWNGKEFVPRQMLPLCLSYDHRAINGADAGRFFTYLSALLADVRKLIL